MAVCVVTAAVPAEAGPETWMPVGGLVPAAGFTLDSTNRLESLSMYNAAYLASEGAVARMGWTGNFTGTCAVGTTAVAFQQDVRRRVNYYRALCGLPANISFDAETILNATTAGSPQISGTVKKVVAAQAAAYLGAFSQVFADRSGNPHNPPADLPCYSKTAWNGAAHGNLTTGYHGPRAVDAYIADDDINGDVTQNAIVGHRRWVLHSKARDMSTGDTPPGAYTDGTPILPSNALYVVNDFSKTVSPPVKFVTWPASGFVPKPLMPNRWSISYPGAVFTTGADAITLKGPSGAVIPVLVLSANFPNIGDNTLVFQPKQALPVPGAADATYTATVTGISGTGVPTSFSWTTTFFDPTVLGVAQSISGPVAPAASGADYQGTVIPTATGYEASSATLAAVGDFSESGDGTAPEVVADKTGTYAPLQGAASADGISFTPRTGSRAFHLCFPLEKDEPDYASHPQGFTLTPEFIAGANSVLSFQEMFRWLFTVNRFSVEVTTDGGSQWTEIYGRNGAYPFVNGGTFANNLWDTTWRTRTVSLAAYAGQPIRLRFILRPGAQSFEGTTTNYGAYVDDIAVTGVRRVRTAPVVVFSTAKIRFDAALTGAPVVVGGTYLLRMRPRLGGRAMAYSAPLTVVPVAGPPPSGYSVAFPSLAASPSGDADGDGIGNMMEYAFGLNPMAAVVGQNLPEATRDAAGLTMAFNVPPGISDILYGVDYTRDFVAWSQATNTGAGSARRFVVPFQVGQKVFLRLRVVQQ